VGFIPKQNNMEEKNNVAGKLIGIGAILLLIIIVVFSTVRVVDEGEMGVYIRLGKVVGVKDSGLAFKFPFIDKIKKFNVQTNNVIYEKENPLTSASKDLQDVVISSVVNYRLEANAVGDIYGQFGSQRVFEENVIRPAVRDAVKTSSAKYTAEELVTKRSEFTDAIQTELQKRFTGKFVIVEAVNVTDLQFSKSFNEAIEAKVTAEQRAFTAERDLDRIKFEAEQQVERAKAEAETIRIQAQAIQNQGGKEYVNLKAVEKWNGVLPVQMIPNATVPFINL